jgi:hypothetical protein
LPPIIGSYASQEKILVTASFAMLLHGDFLSDTWEPPIHSIEGKAGCHSRQSFVQGSCSNNQGIKIEQDLQTHLFPTEPDYPKTLDLLSG